MKFKKSTFLILIVTIISTLGFGFTKLTNSSILTLLEELPPLKTYEEILATGIQPEIPPDHNFPTSFQYLNGCVAFAANHILIHKYGSGLDLLEVEKTINKPREILWKKKYVDDFLESYNLERHKYKSAEKFFELMEAGEPVALSYKYPISEDKYVLHNVATYSFDQEGVWISETLSGKVKHLPYSEVFDDSKTKAQYYFATIKYKD